MLPATRIGLRAAPRISAAARILPMMARCGATTVPISKSTSANPNAPASKLETLDPDSRLIQQRLRRPVSPHLAVYKFDQTWFGASAWTRITGCVLSGAMYVYASAYVVAPLAGWHIESASVAAAFGALPWIVKGALKFLAAWPVTFHAINGVRHLVWDLALGFKKETIWLGGWAIYGGSLAAALGLVAFY